MTGGVPIRTLLSRFGYAALVGAAVALMLIGKIETVLVEEVRARATDLAAPLLDLLSRPVARLAAIGENVGELAALREENAQLRAENARLRQWQVTAQRLEGENSSLRSLLRLGPEPAATFVTARAIADTGGSFARLLIVNAGTADGVAPRQVVITGEGLVGRIQQAGRRSARVLPITDLNSKVPVIVGAERWRAILAGDNSDWPQLTFIDGGGEVKRGDLVLTSGHGGIFPPGLPVGIVAGATERGIEVQPFVDWHRLEFVRILDYGQAGPEADINLQR